MYVAVKGGEKAIDAAHQLLAEERRGNPAVPSIGLDQISEQLTLAVDRVMNEGSLYDREWASLAIKQSRGDMIEAIFLVRAARTTLSRFGYSEPVETRAMRVKRRVSAAFKDIPGGQILGPTFDYTHRLLDFSLTDPNATSKAQTAPADSSEAPMPRVLELLSAEGLMEQPSATDAEPGDLTQDPLDFPQGGISACRTSHVAMKASCLRSPIPPSAAMAAPIPSLAKSASAWWRSPSRRKSSAFPS